MVFSQTIYALLWQLRLRPRIIFQRRRVSSVEVRKGQGGGGVNHPGAYSRTAEQGATVLISGLITMSDEGMMGHQFDPQTPFGRMAGVKPPPSRVGVVTILVGGHHNEPVVRYVIHQGGGPNN